MHGEMYIVLAIIQADEIVGNVDKKLIGAIYDSNDLTDEFPFTRSIQKVEDVNVTIVFPRCNIDMLHRRRIFPLVTLGTVTRWATVRGALNRSHQPVRFPGEE